MTFYFTYKIGGPQLVLKFFQYNFWEYWGMTMIHQIIGVLK